MASDQGLKEAQFCLGLTYYNGEFVKRDFGEAQRFWELAAAQGHEEAQKNLVIMQEANELCP